MKVSFDLDGVIAHSSRWFFRLLEPLRLSDPDAAIQAELDYYNSQHLKYHPHLFLADSDSGIIITARKPISWSITHSWLRRYGILLPVYFVDSGNSIDWSQYSDASKESAQLKAEVIQSEDVEVHFDNNPVLVLALREYAPKVKIILVGGER